MSKRTVEVDTLLRRNGRLCQISNIEFREGPVMWDAVIEICNNPDPDKGRFTEVDWNDLRQEIDMGKMEVLDSNEICQVRGVNGCDNSCPVAGWC